MTARSGRSDPDTGTTNADQAGAGITTMMSDPSRCRRRSSTSGGSGGDPAASSQAIAVRIESTYDRHRRQCAASGDSALEGTARLAVTGVRPGLG